MVFCVKMSKNMKKHLLQNAVEPNTEIKQVGNLFLHFGKKLNNFK